MKPALLIIDAQVNMFWPDPAHDSVGLLSRLSQLIETARDADVPVIFVRNGGSGDDPDLPGTPGWEIAPALEPETATAIIDKTEGNSFAGTPLAATLRDLGVDTVVVAGLQSEWCVSATIHGAAEHGFDAVLVRDAHSTYDGKFKAVDVIAHVNDTLATTVRLVDTDTASASW